MRSNLLALTLQSGGTLSRMSKVLLLIIIVLCRGWELRLHPDLSSAHTLAAVMQTNSL